MDGGAERPLGFGFGGRAGSASEDEKKSFALLQDIGKLLSPIGAGEISPGGGGADIGPLMRDGVPGLGVRTVGTHYFDWHHTTTDTLDKVDKEDFRKNVASLAVMAYVLADMPGKLASGQAAGTPGRNLE
ncbi:MAG: hypothetical protein H7039_06535 [Bryobacteraceae bacterium]|nr:hypothetical protein [Bryobacteraceae bacterium]